MEERIIRDPGIQHGKPLIRGTRVPIERIAAELAVGTPDETILVEYGISQKDLAAVKDARR